MNQDTGLLELPGDPVAYEVLQSPRARQFADYLRLVGTEAFAELLEIRQQTDPLADAIVFCVSVQRPQRCVHPIRSKETFVALFSHDTDIAPEVLALRPDFPLVPHINLRTVEFPRSLCLYEQSFEVVKLTWTPAGFLQRIHHWLSRTATGTLHAADQPLEPLIQGSPYQLIVPADFDASELQERPRLMDIFRATGEPGNTTFVARWQDSEAGKAIHTIAVTISSPVQQHGVMRHCPQNLRELHDLCSAIGLDLATLLTETIRNWYLDKPAPNILDAQLMLILALPKSRTPGGAAETTEIRAFLTANSVSQVGSILGAISTTDGVAGFILGEPVADVAQLDKVPLLLVQVQHALDARAAALMNASEPGDLDGVVVGVGAFGSQVLNNLVRAGFGRWTLIDPDTFLPHNGARHLLPARAVGYNKARAVSAVANDVFGGEPIATAIDANVLRPGAREENVANALNGSELTLDFSASVAVSRHLARSGAKARHFSAFVTPSGGGLVITAEDAGRGVRLDWMEMLHYRAVLNESGLQDSLQSPDARLRYGNGCRDVTARLAQDDIAIWAGVTSKEVKRLSKGPSAAVQVFQATPTGAINVFEPKIYERTVLKLGEWMISFDEWLIEKLGRIREGKLPNETGGVLLGAFDTDAKTCSIIDLVPSPPDSTEWPTTYIRGCEGLNAKVQEIKAKLLGQIGYVGEWHSHPRGASIRPSNDDWQAYDWLVGHMHAEALPGIMLIIGDDNQFTLVSFNPRN